MYDYDPELPAGCQAADIEQAAFEEEGRRLAALHRQGICTHGWLIGPAPAFNRTRDQLEEAHRDGMFPDLPVHPSLTCQNDIPEGMAMCIHCGDLVPDPLYQDV